MTDINQEGLEPALLPCPFCGGQARFTHTMRLDDHYPPRIYPYAYVGCDGCGINFPAERYGKQETDPNSSDVLAVERAVAPNWNRRTPLTSLEATKGGEDESCNHCEQATEDVPPVSDLCASCRERIGMAEPTPQATDDDQVERRDIHKSWLEDQVAYHGPMSKDGVAAGCVLVRIEELEAERDMLLQREAGNIIRADKRLDVAEQRVEKMRGSSQKLLDVVNESTGVVGWHLNGDVADWCEFEDIVSEAEAALADTPEGK